MGCFSYMCKKCGKPIESDSIRGQQCKLFLLVDGVVIEGMEGEYDSYGRVFDENGNSLEWDMDWIKIVNLHFNHKITNGIAAFHKRCYSGVLPEEISNDDPNQGWGRFRPQKNAFKGGKKISINILSSLMDIEETEENKKFKKAYEHLKQKFTSGNEIPVPQNTITKEEWDAIYPILKKHYGSI